MISWRTRRATERLEPTVSERWLGIADQLSDNERPLDAIGAWLVSPDHRELSIVLLSHLALHVRSMEAAGTFPTRSPYAIPFADSLALAMTDDGSLIIHGMSRPSELFGSTVLDLAPDGWGFACRLRKAWEAQTGHRATGQWQERSWTRRERRRWAKAWSGYRQGADDSPSRRS